MTSQRVTATAAATLVYGPAALTRVVRIHNCDTANGVDLGGATVATGAGYPLAFGADVELTVFAGDSVYAVCAATKTAAIATLVGA